MKDVVYLNGKILPRNQACISPNDRGFNFADGVYEVIKYYKGQSFCFKEHINRLNKSLSAIRIGNVETDHFANICKRIIESNGMENEHAVVYIQITRGTYIRVHKFPDPPVEPTVYISSFPFPIQYNEMKHGIKVITHDDIRWHRCDIKSIALLPNVLMHQKAIENDAMDCFFIRNGLYTESTHSNIMAIRQGELYTHPDSGYILPGITKMVVFRLCRKLNIVVREEPIEASGIAEYDEFFITGTGSEIMPVVRIDDHTVKNGFPGPVTRKLQDAFFEITYTKLAGEKIEFK